MKPAASDPRAMLLALFRADSPLDVAVADALRSDSSRLSWNPTSLGPAADVARTYERRAAHLQRNHIREIGSAQFVASLHALGAQEVFLAQVHTATWNFNIAITGDLDRVVGFEAVDASVAIPEWDWSASHPY